MIKNFYIIIRHDLFFFKKFPLCKCFCKIRTHFLSRAQLMTDTVCKKRNSMRFYSGFGIKLTIFMALINCFRKNFMDFLRFVFVSLDVCSSMT